MAPRQLTCSRGALLVGAVLMMLIVTGCGSSSNGGSNSSGPSTTQAPTSARDRTGSNEQTAQPGTGSGGTDTGAGDNTQMTGANGEKLSEPQILAKLCPEVKDTDDSAPAQGSGDAKNYGTLAMQFSQSLAKKCQAQAKP